MSRLTWEWTERDERARENRVRVAESLLKKEGYTVLAPGQSEYVKVVHCVECVHCEKSCYAGFFHCESWDQEISMQAHDPYKYYCAEGERDEA